MIISDEYGIRNSAATRHLKEIPNENSSNHNRQINHKNSHIGSFIHRDPDKSLWMNPSVTTNGVSAERIRLQKLLPTQQQK